MANTSDSRHVGHAFGAAYDNALRLHIHNPGEEALRSAYEIGRRAVELDVNVLTLASVHHQSLLAILESKPHEHVGDTVRAAADFLAEALTAFEVLRRGYREARDAELEQRHHAAVIRRLSTLLADASLAAAGENALQEVLQLVVEQALELTGAAKCKADLNTRSLSSEVSSYSADASRAPRTDADPRPDLIVPLTCLDGSTLGSIQLWSENLSRFSELDEALALHLAQMASAAVDRTLFYGTSSPLA